MPAGAGLGCQGPDQGYALKLAERFRDRLVLMPGEHPDDVLAGCCAIALRRASLFGRAPVVYDLTLALDLFGYLSEAAADLVAKRRKQFAGASSHHGYHIRLHLAASIPEKSLISSATDPEK